MNEYMQALIFVYSLSYSLMAVIKGDGVGYSFISFPFVNSGLRKNEGKNWQRLVGESENLITGL